MKYMLFASRFAILVAFLCGTHSTCALAVSEADLAPLVEDQNVEAVETLGADAMPVLVRLYQNSEIAKRTKIAAIFYGLGWKSEEAKAALMKDIKTDDSALRLQVQWALGRVSSDDEVVTQLLGNMRNDPNPLFRDKAACALANDQIHLTEKQKAKLYEGVIAALADEKDDVRHIAGLVMQIQTGQTKGYDSNGPPEARAASILAWEKWLEEFKSASAHDK